MLQLFQVEDIIEKRGEGEDREVLVRWANWVEPPEWVRLSTQPELKRYLNQNEANPHSCSLVNQQLGEAPVVHENLEVQALRQAIFLCLGWGPIHMRGQAWHGGSGDCVHAILKRII